MITDKISNSLMTDLTLKRMGRLEIAFSLIFFYLSGSSNCLSAASGLAGSKEIIDRAFLFQAAL